MSGIAVTRVLTREELMAPSLKLLHTLTNTLQRYAGCMSKEDTESLNTLQVLQQRLNELHAQVQNASSFKSLEIKLAALLDFAKVKQAETLQTSIKQQALKWQLEQTTQTMQDFRNNELQNALQTDVHQDNILSETQQKILDALQEGQSPAPQPTWETEHTSNTSKNTRLERSMAELELLHQPTSQKYTERWKALVHQPRGQRWDMLRDSLLLDLSQEIKAQKELEQASVALQDLASFKTLTANQQEAVTQALYSRNLEKIQRTHAALEAAFKAMEEEEFTRIRKATVLNALAELGYARGLDMSTAVEEEGRIILRENATSDYGLEISGASLPRMQLRVVSFKQDGNKAEHEAAEAKWCKHLDTLQTVTREKGMELLIDVRKEPGEVPMKTIASNKSSTPATARALLSKTHP